MKRIGSSIASSYAALASQVAFLVVMLAYVTAERPEDVGGWGIVLAAVGFLRLIDLGVGAATTRYAARAASPHELNVIVSTSLAFLGGLAAIGVIVSLGLGAVSPDAFGDVEGLPVALAVASASTALQVPLQAFGNVLFGVGRITERNLFVIARQLASATAIVVAIELGAGLAGFVSAAAAAELVVAIAQALYTLRRVPGLAPSRADVHRETLRELAPFTLAVLGLNVAAQVAYYSGGLVIGVALTTTAVQLYTYAMRASDGVAQLLAQFADVFMPVFSRLDATGDGEDAARVLYAGTRATLVIGYPLIALLIGLGEPLIVLWVGEPYAEAWEPLALLAGALALSVPLRFAVLWSIGAARHRPVSALAVADAVVNLALSIALVGPYGINGVALAGLIAIGVSNALIMPFVIYAALGRSVWRYHYRPMLIALALVAPACYALRAVVTDRVVGDGLLTLAAVAAWLAVAVPVLAAALLSPRERQAVLRGLLRYVPRPREAA